MTHAQNFGRTDEFYSISVSCALKSISMFLLKVFGTRKVKDINRTAKPMYEEEGLNRTAKPMTEEDEQ